MSTRVAHRQAVGIARNSELTAGLVDELPADAVRPLLEGARARGLADAFELMGVPALLIDSTGAVLHAGSGVAAQMGRTIAVASQHLVGADPQTNRAVQDLVAAALAGESKTVEVEVGGAARGLALRAIPVPCGRENPYQLMKAVIVFGDAAKSIDERASCD